MTVNINILKNNRSEINSCLASRFSSELTCSRNNDSSVFLVDSIPARTLEAMQKMYLVEARNQIPLMILPSNLCTIQNKRAVNKISTHCLETSNKEGKQCDQDY